MTAKVESLLRRGGGVHGRGAQPSMIFDGVDLI